MRLELTAAAYDDPVAAALIEAVQREYEVRYGGRDITAVTPAEFSPPHGLFLVGRLDTEPVVCGGWRLVEPGLGEIKRMYVVDAHRRRGLSRVLLAELEATARAAGLRRLRLETGHAQPEAIRLYETSGYTRIDKFGVYRDHAGSTCFGKALD
ncbi:MAG TPA: GNAT family N-acetyltransferase [Sporichthyaceae bacterium]